MKFLDLNLNPPLLNALEELNFDSPTLIQEKAYNVILSGKDVVGISQTGTGKTFAYLLPILRNLKFSKQQNPRVLILAPTRELVIQVVNEIEKLTVFMNVRIKGIYGGVNINTQASELREGVDIMVATPVRLYDLTLQRSISLKSIQKLVIDEVDVMLDLGFKFQVENVLELLPLQKQGILFSATMTEKVADIITNSFKTPEVISTGISGIPLTNIHQKRYDVHNFLTKLNLLVYLLADKATFCKTIVFVSSKRLADRIFEKLEHEYPSQSCVIHANKNQNYRQRSVESFEEGRHRILIATDVMARGVDFDNVSQVISIDTPIYPENYIHRIGRTGRAEKKGESILMTTANELTFLNGIEDLMQQKIGVLDFPDEVTINPQLIPEERPKLRNKTPKKRNDNEGGGAFHEKSKKNSKVNLGSSYWRTKGDKYKKPKRKPPKGKK